MSVIFWWILQFVLVLASCFFLLFGINLLIAAYGLENPFWFIMTFFASIGNHQQTINGIFNIYRRNYGSGSAR